MKISLYALQGKIFFWVIIRAGQKKLRCDSLWSNVYHIRKNPRLAISFDSTDLFRMHTAVPFLFTWLIHTSIDCCTCVYHIGVSFLRRPKFVLIVQSWEVLTMYRSVYSENRLSDRNMCSNRGCSLIELLHIFFSFAGFELWRSGTLT